MLTWRTPRWIYVVAAVYVLTICFNARQEAWGPGNAGWVPRWPSFKVAAVVPSGPMDKAGLRAGDVLEAVNGQPLNGMPDWFIARAHFERNCPLAIARASYSPRQATAFVAVRYHCSQLAHLEQSAVSWCSWILFCSLHPALARDPRGFQPPRATQRSPRGPDVCNWSGRRRLSKFGMGSCASSLACSARNSYMSRHGLLPAGTDGLAAFLCELSSSSAVATGAMGGGAPAYRDSWIPDSGLVNGNDLRTIAIGKALAVDPFGGPSARHTRHCRCHSLTVS